MIPTAVGWTREVKSGCLGKNDLCVHSGGSLSMDGDRKTNSVENGAQSLFLI